MKKLLTLLFFLCTASTAHAVCSHYASQSGGGNGLAVGTPFTIAAFFALPPVPGNELCLIDGEYTGDNSMIIPPVNLSGTSGNPITIKAINDGKVTINGQGVRRPIGLFQNNNWWVIEGVNAKSSPHNVVGIANSSDDVVIRRVIAWDAPVGDNFMCFSVSGSERALFEDVAGWGNCRKIFEASQGGNNAIFRRAFGIYNRHTSGSPTNIFTIGYNATGGLCENCIGMWNQLSTPLDPYGMFVFGGFTTGSSSVANAKYLGGIGIVRTTFTVSNWLGMIFGTQLVAGAEFKDMTLYNDAGSHTGLRAILGQLFAPLIGPSTCAPTCNRLITNVTEIGFGTADSINTTSNGWTVTNKQSYGTLAAMIGANANPLQNNTGTGARACKRYEDGKLTSIALWPWPMDARINAALTESGQSSSAYFGIGKDLTTYIETLFGIIPDSCRSSGGGGGGGGGPRGPTGVIIF